MFCYSNKNTINEQHPVQVWQSTVFHGALWNLKESYDILESLVQFYGIKADKYEYDNYVTQNNNSMSEQSESWFVSMCPDSTLFNRSAIDPRAHFCRCGWWGWSQYGSWSLGVALVWIHLFFNLESYSCWQHLFWSFFFIQRALLLWKENYSILWDSMKLWFCFAWFIVLRMISLKIHWQENPLGFRHWNILMWSILNLCLQRRLFRTFKQRLKPTKVKLQPLSGIVD